jgi:hypothetical protein
MVSGFSTISHQATAFLNTLDANFEQIFHLDDERLQRLSSTSDQKPTVLQPIQSPGPVRRMLPTKTNLALGKAKKGKLGACRLSQEGSSKRDAGKQSDENDGQSNSAALHLNSPSNKVEDR